MIVLEPLYKYGVFHGRASRKEYWVFFIVVTLVTTLLSYVDAAVGAWSASLQVGLLSGIFQLAMLVPSIAVGVRRLHDTDRPGLWMLMLLIPIIGWIWLIVLLCFRGDEEENSYGEPPMEYDDDQDEYDDEYDDED